MAERRVSSRSDLCGHPRRSMAGRSRRYGPGADQPPKRPSDRASGGAACVPSPPPISSGIPHMEPSQPVECDSKPLDVQLAFE